MAKFVPIGEPVHDAERQALRILVDSLPDDYLVYGNAWITERGRGTFELDAVVVAPHAIYVVEFKSYRGTIQGNDNDWYTPETIRSPLKLNRLTAQILHDRLGYLSAGPYVEHFVFLSHATAHRVSGQVSNERVHLKTTIIQALQNKTALHRRVGQRPPVDDATRKRLHDLFTGSERGRPPIRSIREWELVSVADRTDRYVEHLARHRIDDRPAILRVYEAPMLGNEADRRQPEERFRWEAQVLRRIGEHKYILDADAPFTEGALFVLPFERFEGITLTSWLDKYGPKLSGQAGIEARVALWKKIAVAVAFAHGQGIVHRLLRPEVVLVADTLDDPDLRVTGFELAKQLHHSGTIATSSLSDDRRRFAAPEVVRAFSDADARSDQFSLGALLGQILVGRPLFDSTEELVRRNGVFTRIRDVNASFKQALDKAVSTMLEVAAANRFPSVGQAIAAVEQALQGRPATPLIPQFQEPDPDNLVKGVLIGHDYESGDCIGQGGLATVYAARHLVSGTTRALKVARSEPRAIEVLRAEYDALRRLNHRNIVRAIDITNIVGGRTTLVLERVQGKNLAQRLRQGPLSFEERQRYAEHFFSALIYLEEQRVTHKDLKPDNLIVGDEGLTVIDFSLAGEPADATLVGTALYRDPALVAWSPESDRYAAALCLYELYVGRHAFDGQAPSPNESPRLDVQDFDQPGLVEFFRKALNPIPALRHPSAVAMRHAFLEALGQRVGGATAAPGEPTLRQTDAPLTLAGLSESALTHLRRAGILTQGALVALDEAKLANLPGLGHKRLEELLTVRRDLIAAGVTPAQVPVVERHSLFPTLVGDERPVQALRQHRLPEAVIDLLARGGLSTIGRLADATRDDLRRIPNIGAGRVAQIIQALQSIAQTGTDELPVTLDGIWAISAQSLSGDQQAILERIYGLRGGPRLTQTELSTELDVPQPTLSIQHRKALEGIDRRLLELLVDHLEGLLITAGGLLRIDDAAARLGERWPIIDPEHFDACGLLRLLAAIMPLRIECRDVLDDHPPEVLIRPGFPHDAIRGFLAAARELATWPPKDSEAARRSLQACLPEYPHDPLGLAIRLDSSLRLTAEGELFESPVDLMDALQHVLRKARLPISLSELRQAIVDHFGEFVTPEPTVEELARLLQSAHHRDCRLDPGEGMVHPPSPRSITPADVESDPLPLELRADPAQNTIKLLRDVADRRGFRLFVAPPKDHAEIARSVARVLGADATFISFEDTFFRRHDAQLAELERAERFSAQRPRLRKAAEALVDTLLAEYGRPGARIVLGDLGLLGLCDALHLVRRIYDQTHTGGRGFWALVIPGVIKQRQPLFNEATGAAVFSLPGMFLPIDAELPAPT